MISFANSTLVIGSGEFVSVVGPTGCGKSTLLNVAAGLLIGMAFVGAVVGEYLGSAAGYLILRAESVFDINAVFAGILVLTAFALALDGIVTAAERRLLMWRPSQSETELS